MLVEFFYALRRSGLKVGIQEWLTLLEALARGLHGNSLDSFYHIARAILCKQESELDLFDQVFAAHFKGAVPVAEKLQEELLRWLQDPRLLEYIDPELLEQMKQLDPDELRKLFEERLAEQREQHDGGDRWIGTGGTSPFGWGGANPSGMRLGGTGRRGSAMQWAEMRRFREYRTDLKLDVRQIKVALAKLRELTREGRRRELDLDGTIDATCKNAGELELRFRAPRKNNIKLILAMDVGGSMDPHRRLVSRLFSAAHGINHFKEFKAYYFHNCVYEHLYEDAAFYEPVAVAEVLRTYPKDTKLVIVGDALMHPAELFAAHGAGYYYHLNPSPGIECLMRLSDHFSRAVWLNPEPRRLWRHPTVEGIGHVFPMFELTVDGLQAAVARLTKGRGRAAA